MDLLKNLAYAGLGLLDSTDEALKAKFAELVEKGKNTDEISSRLIEDFFKSVDDLDGTVKTKYNESLETLEELIDRIKVKATDEV